MVLQSAADMIDPCEQCLWTSGDSSVLPRLANFDADPERGLRQLWCRLQGWSGAEILYYTATLDAAVHAPSKKTLLLSMQKLFFHYITLVLPF